MFARLLPSCTKEWLFEHLANDSADVCSAVRMLAMLYKTGAEAKVVKKMMVETRSMHALNWDA